jgi:hypothetical protein
MSQEHSTTDETGKIRSNCDAATDVVCVATEQLQALIIELRGIAREIAAGKVQGAWEVRRLAATLVRWKSNQFAPLVWKFVALVDSAWQAGFDEGLFCIPIGEEPFRSAFGNANKWYHEHPEDFPGALSPLS